MSELLHTPVLLEEILKVFSEQTRPMNFFMDGTFGRGGHCRKILERFSEVKALAVDQDEEAIRYGEENFADYRAENRLHFLHANFRNMDKVLECAEKTYQAKGFDGILVDLGVSSPQLDDADRGFSFYKSGPLDMRMDRSVDIQAKDIINEWDAEDLVELFQKYGEVRNPYRVVDAIVEQRKESPFETTMELSKTIEKVMGWRKRGQHPATQFFLALRMQVNGELEYLEDSLKALVSALNPGGRLLVITFHSLEDRIAKYCLRGLQDVGELVNRKVIKPQREEVKENARARSAKLRAFQKGSLDNMGER